MLAHQYLVGEATRAGLHSWTDTAGNLFFSRRPIADDRRCVLLGSHLDTVIGGGSLDGAYGVVAALEVLEVCVEAHQACAVEPVVVIFANEEGALFPQAFWGSLALTGQFSELPSQPVDRQGASLRGPLRDAGGDLDRLPEARWVPGRCAAYLELHIEQGPVLEAAGLVIGVVDAIVGRTVLDVEVEGKAGHAGTVPMAERRDALATASRIVLLAESIARSGCCHVATVGYLNVLPGQVNVIPGSVRAAVDLRDSSAVRLASAEKALLSGIKEIGAATRCKVTACTATRVAPVATDPALRTLLERSAAGLGLSTLSLPSGAGHDAQVVAAIAPIGMIFVPSIGGLSHVPEERSHPADLVSGAEVLLRAALAIAAGQVA